MDNTRIENEMGRYYRDRAPVYDLVYEYPERQDDLRFLEKYMAAAFNGKHVLEVAAGTGYWTRFISMQAARITATDAEPAPLAHLQDRELLCPVETKVHDAYELDQPQEQYDAAFAGLWLSHVPLSRVPDFLNSLHSVMKPGARVILMDNSAAQCARLPVSHRDEQGNTYQLRQLDSGESYLILKNFPTLEELRGYVREYGDEEKYVDLENFWLFQYRSH